MATLSMSDAARRRRSAHPATGAPGWPPRAHPGASPHAGGVSTGRYVQTTAPQGHAPGARPAAALGAPPRPVRRQARRCAATNGSATELHLLPAPARFFG